MSITTHTHRFGSNDGQPIDDHCSQCGCPWERRFVEPSCFDCCREEAEYVAGAERAQAWAEDEAMGAVLVDAAEFMPEFTQGEKRPKHLHRFDEDGFCACGVSMDPDEIDPEYPVTQYELLGAIAERDGTIEELRFELALAAQESERDAKLIAALRLRNSEQRKRIAELEDLVERREATVRAMDYLIDAATDRITQLENSL